MKNIHLIPTDNVSKIFYSGNNSELLFSKEPISFRTFERSPQNIYITDDSEIKDRNCWVTNGEDVCKPLDGYSLEYANRYWEKIILTTDPKLIADDVQSIDNEFLQWFVKNPSCEEVEVKHKEVIQYGNMTMYDHNGDGSHYFCNDCEVETSRSKEELLKFGVEYYKIIIPNLEVWKDVPEFEGYYQVSNLGNVKSLSRTILGRGKHNTLLKERLLRFSTSTNGYYQVILQKEGFKKIYKVHSLVAICFLNHTPDGTHNVVIDHINEVKKDNRLENLRLIGHRENVARSMKNNTSTYVGVSWSKNAKKWISQITIEGKTKYLGLFDNEEDANKKYLETLKDL